MILRNISIAIPFTIILFVLHWVVGDIYFAKFADFNKIRSEVRQELLKKFDGDYSSKKYTELLIKHNFEEAPTIDWFHRERVVSQIVILELKSIYLSKNNIDNLRLQTNKAYYFDFLACVLRLKNFMEIPPERILSQSEIDRSVEGYLSYQERNMLLHESKALLKQYGEYVSAATSRRIDAFLLL